MDHHDDDHEMDRYDDGDHGRCQCPGPCHYHGHGHEHDHDHEHGPAGADVPFGVYTAEEVLALEAVQHSTKYSSKTAFSPKNVTAKFNAFEDGGHEDDVLTFVLDFKEPGQGNTSDIFNNVITTFDVASYGFAAAQFDLIAESILAAIDEDYFAELVGTVAGPEGQDLAVDFVIGDIGTPLVGVSEYYFVQIGTGISGPHSGGTLGVAGGSVVRNATGVGPNFGIQVGDVVASVFTDAINGIGLTPSNALTSGNLEFTVNAIAGTLSHEIGHNVSLSHINNVGSVQPTPGAAPIMGTGAIDLPNNLRITDREFSLSGFDNQNGAAPRMHIQQLVDAIGLHDLPTLDVGQWEPQGPFSATNGQVENLQPANQVVGAIHTVLAHPTNANILYIGATNGGVWRTENATATFPDWTPLTDTLPSQSIGAMTFDTADPTSQTIYVGTGRFSSFGRIGNDRAGVYKTTDGGDTWTILDAQLAGANISGIVANGNNVLVSVNTADNFGAANRGVFRSTDGGVTFSQVSVGNGSATGLPDGSSYDLVADPINPATAYTSVTFSSGQNGIYKTTNGGASWSLVSTPGINALIGNGTSNLELAVGRNNNVYAAIINFGNLVGLFRSGDGGATWVQMDTPSTNENGTDVGLNPRGGKGPQEAENPTPEEIAGGQGSIHFSIVADPTNANIVYVGGDRQPRSFGDTGSFPNSIGARDFSGRLFRGNATLPAGSQFVHLTHSNVLGAPGGGTASGSSPHADSRELTFDAAGNLIEVDDGGVYRRTNPRSNTGDWFGINGDLQVTEAHDVAYDSLSGTLITGNQDTGTTYQPNAGAETWVSLSTADGGDVVVDNVSLASVNQSIRYTSFQNLGGFRRTVWNASGDLISTSFPALTGFSGGAFRTPVELNVIDPNRLAIQGSGQTFETFNQGGSVTGLGVAGNGGISQNAIAYGGRRDGADNANVLWVGSGSDVFVRTTPAGALAATPADPTSSTIRDLAIDPDDWASVFVIDNNSVFATDDIGASWSDVTGNLLGLASTFYAAAFVPGPIIDAVVVGTNAGVFASLTDSLGTWIRLGSDLPNVLVYDLDYDATDDVLAAGTLGRGAWTLGDVTGLFESVQTIVAATPFQRLEPLGGSVSHSVGNIGTLGGAAASTAFTFPVSAGETIAASVVSSNVNATLTVELLNEFGGSIAGGTADVLPAVTVGGDGTYQVRVQADMAADFELIIHRNASAESFVGDSGIANPMTVNRAAGPAGHDGFAIVGTSIGDPSVTFTQSNNPALFVDISGSGAALSLGDDSVTTIVTTIGNGLLPAGNVTVSNNGGLLAGINRTLPFTNTTLPTSVFGNALLPFWDDLDAEAGNVYWQETTIDGIDALIVQWNDRPHYSDIGDATFQVQLFASGPVLARYAYQDVDFNDVAFDGGRSATIGYQSAVAAGVAYSFNTAVLADGDVIELSELISPDIDRYAIDLSASVGNPIDVVLAGHDGIDFSGQTLQLIGPNGTVLATAPAGTALTNASLVIENFVVPDIGNNIYQLSIDSDIAGSYGIVVSDSVTFDVEPNNDPAVDPLRSLDVSPAAVGYLSSLDSIDLMSITLSANQSIVVRTSTPLDDPAITPVNNLDPELAVLSGDGKTVLISDLDSQDGKNARLTFTAPAAGVYLIQVSATSGTGEYTVAFSDPTPPVIEAAFATSTLWNGTFVDAIDGGVGGGIGTGNGIGAELTPNRRIPNSGVNQFVIQFNEPVIGFNADNVSITGALTANYASQISSVTFDNDSFLGTITLASPIAIDRLRLGVNDLVVNEFGNRLDGDGDDVAGGIFDLVFSILVGDANANDTVSASDLTSISGVFGQTFAAGSGYVTRGDWNSDGTISSGDLNAFRVTSGRTLPNTPPAAPSFGSPDNSGGSGSSSGNRGGRLSGPASDSFFSSLGGDDDDDKSLSRGSGRLF